MTLTEFLAARLDEDEAAAKAAEGRPEFDGTGIVIQHNLGGDRSVVMPSHVAAHIARHDPARVLREVEAGRKTLAYYQEAQQKLDYAVAHPDEFSAGDAGLYVGKVAASMTAVRLRAAVYSDHPDYDEAWRPLT